jgi:glycine/D-amino acid oxidase-like deaminating enzyme
MYGKPTPTTGIAVSTGLASTGFAYGVWLALALALIVAGGLLVRFGMLRRSSGNHQ